jgi:hypothetical protein
MHVLVDQHVDVHVHVDEVRIGKGNACGRKASLET